MLRTTINLNPLFAAQLLLLVMSFLQVNAKQVNVANFGAKGDGVQDDTMPIVKAIATLKDGDILVFNGNYKVSPNRQLMQGWEIIPAIFNLPDCSYTIEGNNSKFIIDDRSGDNGLCLFRTAFMSRKRTAIKSLSIQGRGNAGANNNLIDGITVNGSSNGIYSNINVYDTKRHGIYLIHGASYNTFTNIRIERTNREMLGCGIQLEGASNNVFSKLILRDIGANAIDLNQWVPSNFYPQSSNSPYKQEGSYKSSYNQFNIVLIENTGVNNNLSYLGGGTNNVDDDYYGINIIRGSNNNQFVFNTIKNIRLDVGKIAPAKSTYAAAIRIMGSNGNVIRGKEIVNTGNYIVRMEGAERNSLDVDYCTGYRSLYPPDTSKKNVIKVKRK